MKKIINDPNSEMAPMEMELWKELRKAKPDSFKLPSISLIHTSWHTTSWQMFMNLYVVLVIKYFWVTGETNNGFLKVLKRFWKYLEYTTEPFEPNIIKYALQRSEMTTVKLDIMNKQAIVHEYNAYKRVVGMTGG